MPAQQPVATVPRLLACIESFAWHEEGASGQGDWPALVKTLERELALLVRIAAEAPELSGELSRRADALQARYKSLSKHIASARRRDEQELASLGETNRRIRAIKHAYARETVA